MVSEGDAMPTGTSPAGSRGLPLYRRIANDLRRAVNDKVIKPGEALDGENVLQEKYKCSKFTARRAIRVLIDEGLVEPRRGSGTYVRNFPLVVRHGQERLQEDAQGNMSIFDHDAMGREHEVGWISGSIDIPPKDVEKFFGENVQAVIRKRLYRVDGRNVHLAITYLPAYLFPEPKLLEQERVPGGSVWSMLSHLGHNPVKKFEFSSSRMPTQEEAAALGLPQGTPVSVLRRFTFAADEVLIDLTDSLYDATRWIFAYDVSKSAIPMPEKLRELCDNGPRGSLLPEKFFERT
ncbi:GntR family transcriptional regulator [Planomonospora sp. ID91781]|uniref:GntR family transcriptional regulator n=1 Tax=Planomonospora sp. ID91781 TaxID=2738135 RepID=UPI0018C3CCCE|nr:GntR family transcriptional regulator [Planomonospora sp. ID91781]MBG0826157.1 GntR family transcriptional regulator [Planomonospora sp. ID91781]